MVVKMGIRVGPCVGHRLRHGVHDTPALSSPPYRPELWSPFSRPRGTPVSPVATATSITAPHRSNVSHQANAPIHRRSTSHHQARYILTTHARAGSGEHPNGEHPNEGVICRTTSIASHTQRRKRRAWSRRWHCHPRHSRMQGQTRASTPQSPERSQHAEGPIRRSPRLAWIGN